MDIAHLFAFIYCCYILTMNTQMGEKANCYVRTDRVSYKGGFAKHRNHYQISSRFNKT